MDFSSLPETERLAHVATALHRVQNDAVEVTRVLLKLRSTPQQELMDRWRPVIEEAAEGVVRAAVVLERSMRELRARPKDTGISWGSATKKGGWVHDLLATGKALTELLVRLQAYEIEGRSIDQLNTLRLHSLVSLPPAAQAALLQEPRDG